MIESQSWQWLASKDWGNNLWKNGDIFFPSDFKENIFTQAVIGNKVENLFGGG